MKSNFEIVPYEDSAFNIWENFLALSPRNSDFMMSRTFLNYHKERFIDQSLMIKLDGKVIAVFPAGSNRGEEHHVISHPGASYGGLSYLHKWGGSYLVEIGGLIIDHYRTQKIESLFVKPKPLIYSVPTGSEDLYVWWRNGGHIERVDLTNVIEVKLFEPSNRRRRGIKKLQKSQVEIFSGMNQLSTVYELCATTVRDRYRVNLVHSMDDLEYICKRLPNNVRITSCAIDGNVESGLILFVNQNAAVVQYWGSTNKGRKINSQDLLVEEAILWCRDNSLTWFVPGVSTSDSGQKVDMGIYEYKVSLGSGTISQPFLKIQL